jgi:4-amino-4-deoxy-L-arabinose transferase-like glycosyltransferase
MINSQVHHKPRSKSAPRPAWAALWRLEWALFIVGVAVYIATRAVGLERFPIYFFCDEAILVVRAEELLRNGLRDADGTLLPTFLQNADRWNLGLPVYIHLISVALWGKSVVVARATSAAISVLGTLAIALALKEAFRSRLWWCAPLVLATMPAWFLHTRTAFDPVMMASFYACFLCVYVLYRVRSPRWVYAALVYAAATCYSYPNGQAVMLASGVLLLVSDLRYHVWQGWKLWIGAAALALVLLLPLLRFQWQHPDALGDQLRVLDSYIMQPLPLGHKIATFARLYAQALDPRYWFFPNEGDWTRHRWLGVGHLGQWLLPFVALGLGRSIWCWRSSHYRVVLIALLAAPAGAALLQIAVTRTLAMVVPAALLACIGLDQCWWWLQRRRVRFVPFALGTTTLLSTLAFVLLRAALVNSPTWFNEYGLYGMQYGAAQVFGAVRDELARSPDARLLITHTWANNPNAFIPFFLNEAEQARVGMTTLAPWSETRRPIEPNTVFVLTAQEYREAEASGKFVIGPPVRVLPYPDGTPGFFFVRLEYSSQADQLFAAERAQRQRLVDDLAVIDRRSVPVRHSPLDLGGMSALFDGDTDTLIRGVDANPLVLEWHFPVPRAIGTIAIDGWSQQIDLAAAITTPNGTTTRYASSYYDQPHNPHIDWTLPNGPHTVSVLRLEIKNAGEGEVSKVHVREIKLVP